MLWFWNCNMHLDARATWSGDLSRIMDLAAWPVGACVCSVWEPV